MAEVDSDAAQTLVEIENPVVQRQFVQTYKTTDVDGEAVARALNRRDSLGTQTQRREITELWESSGHDGIEFTATADAGTVRVIADGSGSVDDSFDRAVARAANGDTIESYDQLDSAVRKIDDLEGSRQTRAKELVANADGAGLKLVDELDTPTLRRIFDDEDVAVEDLSRATRKYADLDERRSEQFRGLLADDELRDSWVRVVSKDAVDTDSVKHSLDSVDRIQESASVDEFYIGRRVQEQEYPSSWDDVYPKDSIVTEYTLTDDVEFYRMYTEGGNDKAGRFLLGSTDDISTMSPTGLQGKYAIPGDPPDTVAKADIPAGTTMRTGKVAANDFGSGGGQQFTLPRSQLPNLPEDWFEKAPELTQKLISDS